MQTADTVLYNEALHHSGAATKAPMLDKRMLYVNNNEGNSSSYSDNVVTFETMTLSNGGRWCDYSEGYISIPVVTTVLRSGTHQTAAQAAQSIHFKSGPVIIDSVQIQYGNNPMVQQRKHVSAYSSFKQHTTYSQDDVAVVGDSSSYFKPSSKWDYDDANGFGLISYDVMKKAGDPQFLSTANVSQASVMGASLKNSGVDVYEKVGNTHVFYHDCIIRLKDLLFFQELEIVKGSNIILTISLNQCEMVTTYTAGVLTHANSLQGSVCPVMRCVSNLTEAEQNTEDAATFTETVSVKVVKNGAHAHKKTQCRLYVPTYTMEPQAEIAYLTAQSVQKIRYCDINVSHIRNVQSGQTFSHLITNSLARAKRLIVVPMLSAQAAAAGSPALLAPQTSLFCSEPATCSPCYIKDFQVSISGTNVYMTQNQYPYERFQDEMAGKQGLNGGRNTGLMSGMIGLKDYESNFGYLVCDLSRRRAEDEMTPVALTISGSLESPLQMDFLVFCEYEKDISIDISTGAMED